MFKIRVFQKTARAGAALLICGISLLAPFASPSTASAHNGHPHQLRLVSLRCWEPEDSEIDEAFIKVDGVKVWGPHGMWRDGERSLLNVTSRLFADNVTIKLYDEDGGFLDPNDHLGTVVVQAADAGTGDHTIWFIADNDAVYSMVYRVI